METERAEVITPTAICPRCGGKGLILCPQCQGTGDERNDCYVVVGSCPLCAGKTPTVKRGFATCPKCQGHGAIAAVHLYQVDRSQPPLSLA